MTIANRTLQRADALAQRVETFGDVAVDTAPLAALLGADHLSDASIVVNTTSVSLGAKPFRIRPTFTPRDCLFVDLVYGSHDAPFLAAARRAGRPTLDGAGMLLHQGALAFEAWTERKAPLAAMARALRTQGLTIG